MIEIENVSFAHGRSKILHDVTLTIPKGGVTAIIGPNGAGKSTLLSLVARLHALQSGTIRVGGLPVDSTPTRELAKALAILRQDPGVSSRLRVEELVGFGRFPHSRGRLTPEDKERVAEALDQFDLTGLKNRFVETLSGGQRQRALIAMAFCQATDYLLLDEPLNNLDMIYARELMRRVREAADRHGRTILTVLHDINQAAAYADRIVAMRDGRVASEGPPESMMTPQALEAAFGYPVRVASVEGKPVILHHL